MVSGAYREISLEEYCRKMPDDHAVNRELRVLRHCREHPFKWALWDLARKVGFRPKSPIAKERP